MSSYFLRLPVQHQVFTRLWITASSCMLPPGSIKKPIQHRRTQ
uniref:Uncharacterized protein n=1 Tax=Callorhinchus milii TaxID=7868 RepID=A0A4W3IGB4_CALMI